MTLGEKIKAARLEAGLSQRQLCGDTITRNMLSQIENGSANPSMSTLRYLAEKLGKNVSYFLQEQAVDSPNPPIMSQARELYRQRQYSAALQALAGYQNPDSVFDEEYHYLYVLCALPQAEAFLGQRQPLEAVALLDNIRRDGLYYRPEQEQIRRQLLAQAYTMLEEYYRNLGNFEQAYYCACKLREIS